VEVQAVTTTAAAADLGGTFTLTYDGQTTGALPRLPRLPKSTQRSKH
jgi:hypothetical protein